MTQPWRSVAARMPASAYAEAGRKWNLDPAIIRAVFAVESAGRPYRADRSVERRYEPHHMPGSGITNWRESLKMPFRAREAAFAKAYARNPEAALRATSWGGPQIMGFNCEAAGYRSALAMVQAMAAREQAHLDAFMTLIAGWGLITKLRAHDWRGFAARYNGSGQAATYAARIEKAYRAETGKASPAVLRLGSSGAAVVKLQRALGVPDNGRFDQSTRAAVIAFQSRQGLKPDGIAGAKTWAALEAIGAAGAASTPTQSASTGWAALIDLISRILGGTK